METQSEDVPAESVAEPQLCESCRQKELEEIQGKIQKIVTEKEAAIVHLSRVIQAKKEKLVDLVKCRQALAKTWGDVLSARSKVKLMRQGCEMGRASQQQELEELKLLKKMNNRRDERLARVRTKNLHKKESLAKQEYADTHKMATSQAMELQEMRRQLVTDVFRGVFQIEVEPLSEEDAGEEDYQSSVLIDCDSVLEVDDGWMLGGVHRHTLPNIRIVTASMPANGNYTAFLKAASEKRKARLEATQQGVPAPTVTQSASVSVMVESERRLHPLKDVYQSTPAALVYTALFVELIASTLDQPLPHPLSRRAAIGEYGSPNRRKKDFFNSVAKLDDNILYLCFAQSVPLSALTPGHTLQNLLALVTHTQLGRSGAFECQPDMMRYRGRHGSPLTSTLSHDLEDSAPPAVVYTADQSNHSRDSELAESSSDSEENFYSNEREEFEEMYDWEYLEPNIKELRLFEEAQMRAKLAQTRGDQTNTQRLKEVANEAEVRRDRLRRLDYDSTYLDYTAAMTSTRSQTSASNESVRSDESQTEGGGGFFGTLSSLWSSAFGSRPSSS